MFDELLEDPLGGELAVMFRELGVELGLHGGEIFKTIAQFALRVIAHGVGEAKSVPIIRVILDPSLVDPVDNLAQGEWIPRRELGKKKDALVLVDNGVAQESGLGPARTEADHITEGGIEDNAGDFRLGRLVVGQIFTPEKAGVDPAQGFAFGRAEDVFG